MFRLFRHYVPGSYLLLLVLDATALLVSISLGIEVSKLAGLWSPESIDLEWLMSRSIVYTLIIISCMTFMGLYWHHRKESELFDFGLRVLASLILGMLFLALAMYAFPQIAVDRSSMLFALFISLLLISFIRLIHYRISDHDASRSRVLVVGAGKKALMIEKLRRKSDLYGIKIVGYVCVSGANASVPHEKVISSIKSLSAYCEQNYIEEIIVAVDDRRKNFPVDEILECKMDGIIVNEAGDFIERQVKKIRLDTLHPSSMIFSDGYTRAVLNTYSKRFFDITASVLLLVLTFPVIIITALSIWLESGRKGTIIYRQERLGKDGVPFYVLKFRSMKEDAEKDGEAQWAQKDDDRVTKNGKVIRMLRIDELPQLFNVLKGQMSFVGPRPERPQFVEQLSQVIPYYNLRHSVKPGITGWAQISYPYGASEHDAIEKLQYDLYYIKRYSLMFDMLILFQTAQAVLWARGGR